MSEELDTDLCQIAARLQYIPGGWFGVETVGPIRDAAAELRRLSAENAELRARLDAIYSTEPVALHSENQSLPIGTTLIPLPEKS
jgi:hypothetical protein